MAEENDDERDRDREVETPLDDLQIFTGATKKEREGRCEDNTVLEDLEGKRC